VIKLPEPDLSRHRAVSFRIHGIVLRFHCAVFRQEVVLVIVFPTNPSLLGPTALLWDLVFFFSLLIYYTVGRTPWTGDRPVAGHYVHTGQHKHPASSGTRTHDLTFGAGENSSCLRPSGHCDRRFLLITSPNFHHS
jgi:hypothetical protein